MHYHQNAKENWLLRTSAEFGGQTYQAALNACASERERYDFEMRNATSKNIGNMLGWDCTRANSLECHYENLIRDTESQLFLRIAKHLGFSEDERPMCGRVFWRNAIFGGKAKVKEERTFAHIRSGEPEQWRGVFDRKLGEAFLAQFGDVLVKLGYEKDDSWLGGLPAKRGDLDDANPANPAH